MLDLTGRRIERFLQIWVPVLTVVGGALWGLYVYLDHQKEAQRLLAVDARKEANTRAVESRKPFLEKQLQLYFETSQLVGWLVSLTPDDDAWKPIETRYWALYWSELAMVEDRGVEAAMVQFGNRLYDYTARRKLLKDSNQPIDDIGDKRALDGASLELAHAIRASIETGWTGGNFVSAPQP